MINSPIQVGTDPAYPVHVGAEVLGLVDSFSREAENRFLLADQRVFALHGHRLTGLGSCPRLEVTGGESIKCISTLEDVLDAMAAAGLARSSTLITLGGGTVCDLGGLAASLFKRGCGLIHCPTTLLAQVDASVGGKTGLNLAAGKNLAGTFYQPQAVFACTDALETLDQEEWSSGLGEALKTCLLAGDASLGKLEESAPSLMTRESAPCEEVIRMCIQTKAELVALDPLDRGPRRALNLGHTFAHAIEHCAGFGRIPHGVAVAVGVTLAVQASLIQNRLHESKLPSRLGDLLKSLGLPTSLDKLRRQSGCRLPASHLVASLAQDKKAEVGRPEFVLLRAPGQPDLGVHIPKDELLALLA